VRTVRIHPEAFEQLTFWIKADMKTVRKIIELIDDVQKSPFQA